MERLAFDEETRADSWEMAIHLARYGIVAELCIGKRVLDVACGEGYGAYLMTDRWGAAAVEAVDISQEALDSGKEAFPDPRISWKQLNLDTFTEHDFEQKYDLIVSLETIEHLEHPARFLEITSKLLAPDGILCVSWPNDEWYYGKKTTYNPYHKHVWSFEEFQRMAEETLGAAKGYFLGAPVQGICTVPLTSLVNLKNETTLTSLRQTKEVCSLLFPPQTSQTCTTQSSLYFIGMWRNGEGEELRNTASLSWSPASPDTHLKIGHIRPTLDAKGEKARLALVVDSRHSDQGIIAHELMHSLSHSYDTEVVESSTYLNSTKLFFDLLWEKGTKILHFFDPKGCAEALNRLQRDDVRLLFGVEESDFYNLFATAVLTASVSNASLLEATPRINDFLWLLDGYCALSQDSFDHFAKHFTSAPDMVIERHIEPNGFESNFRQASMQWASFFALATSRLDSRSANRRKAFLGSAAPSKSCLATTREADCKPLVVLVADVPKWAYCNISQYVKEYLSDIFEVQIVYVVDYEHWSDLLHDIVCVRNADLIHVFWREYLFEAFSHDAGSAVANKFPITSDAFIEKLSQVAITSSVYDHLNLDESSVAKRQEFFGLLDGYLVSSAKLFSLYSKLFSCPPDIIIEDGVNLDLFTPKESQRVFRDADELVVGWAGNSNWCRNSAYDPKGFHTVLKPAIALLQQEGLPIRGDFADASVNKRCRTEMPDYYREVDLYICTSEIEGTPNPVLEAMGCGVPVISTDVGIVPQVFGEKQKGFILKERSPEALAALLRPILNDRTLLRELSKENLRQIRTWSWKHKMPRWIELFTLALSRVHPRSTRRKYAYFAKVGSRAENDETALPRPDDFIREIDRLSSIIARQERELASRSQELERLRFSKDPESYRLKIRKDANSDNSDPGAALG